MNALAEVLSVERSANERAELRETWKAIMLSPTLEVCEALLRGESVPLERLNQEWVERFGRPER